MAATISSTRTGRSVGAVGELVEPEGAEAEEEEPSEQRDLRDEARHRVERTGRHGAAGVAPDRWKNRMLVAARAAVDGIARLMNVIANCSLVTRSSGTGAGEAARREAPVATRGVWPSTSAREQHGLGRLADRVGDGREPDVGQLGDEEVADEAEHGEPEDRAPADPPDLLEVGHLDAGGLGDRTSARPRARARPGPRRPAAWLSSAAGLEERHQRGGARRAVVVAGGLGRFLRAARRRLGVDGPGGRRGRRARCRRPAGGGHQQLGPVGVHGRRRVDLVGVVELHQHDPPVVAAAQRSGRRCRRQRCRRRAASRAGGPALVEQGSSSTRSGGREAKRSVPRSGRPRRPSPVSLVPAATRGVTGAPRAVGQQQTGRRGARPTRHRFRTSRPPLWRYQRNEPGRTRAS